MQVMKKYTIPLFILLFYSIISTSQDIFISEKPVGEYCILIGKNVGKYNLYGDHCIVICESTDDYIERNLFGGQFFYIDYDCDFLRDKPELLEYCKTVHAKLFGDGKSTHIISSEIEKRILTDAYIKIWKYLLTGKI